MKKTLQQFMIAGIFGIGISTNIVAQSEIIPTADKHALTIACEVCTVLQSNTTLTETQRRYQSLLNTTRIKWCPMACTLLAKVNSGNRLNSREYENVVKMRKAIETGNDGRLTPQNRD